MKKLPEASLLLSRARNNPPAPFKFLPVGLRSPWFGQFMSVPPGAFDVHISSKHQVCNTFIVRATILREGDLEGKEGAEGPIGRQGERNGIRGKVKREEWMPRSDFAVISGVHPPCLSNSLRTVLGPRGRAGLGTADQLSYGGR